MNVYSQYNKHS